MDPFSSESKRARQILSKGLDDTLGWTDRSFTAEETLFCVNRGYLFPARGPGQHQMLMTALPVLSDGLLGRGFILGLSRDVPELRSALGSYGALSLRQPQAISAHQFTAATTASPGACALCGLNDAYSQGELNGMSFERARWGGFRHIFDDYCCFDLWLFSQSALPAVENEDVRCLHTLLDRLRSAGAEETATQTSVRLKGLFRSDKSARSVMMGILGWCGVLHHRQHRESTRSSISGPAACWRGCDGLDEQAVKSYFADYL